MIKSNDNELPRRYPGLKPFERSQSPVFHGRKEDIQRFSNLVIRERLVVLFAKSGIGKTSLLQAGVAPELEGQDFLSILLRTEKTDISISENTREALLKHKHKSGYDSTGEIPGRRQTLWEMVKRLEFELYGLPSTPVLIFDQFEEVFTLAHTDESRNQFLAELADIANDTMPESLRMELVQKFQEGTIDVDTMHWWEKSPEVRVVISIRSDFLHLLDGISSSIPGILRNRYQLHPLNRERARMAIVQPALAEGKYKSNPFTYSEPALTEIINFLAGREAVAKSRDADNAQTTKRKDEIESVNLQIVCQYIEERVIDYQSPENYEVVPEFYGHQTGLLSSIRDFYQNQLKGFPEAYKTRLKARAELGNPVSERDKVLQGIQPDLLIQKVQVLIEEELITSGNRRNSVVDDTLHDKYNVTQDFLDTLVDKSRLLRREPRLDDYYYEISHDTLLEPIIESRDKRREKEKSDREKDEYKQKLEAESQKLNEANQRVVDLTKQRKMARWIATTSVLFTVCGIIFTIWFVRDYISAAQDQLNQAETNASRELFDASIPTYQDLHKHWVREMVIKYTTGKIVLDELNKAQALEEKFRTVEWHSNTADSLMIKDQYVPALTEYRKAKDSIAVYESLNARFSPVDDLRLHRVEHARIAKRFMVLSARIEDTRETLIREFKLAQRDYEVFKEAQIWGQARFYLEKMKLMLPEDNEDLSELSKSLNLIRSETPQSYIEKELAICRQN